MSGYFEEGYIETGYFESAALEAGATLAISSTLSANVGIIKQSSATLNGVFSPNIFAVASRNGSIDMAAQTQFDTDVNANRSANVTLENLVNLSLQAARIRDNAMAIQAAFAAASTANRTRDYSSSLAVSFEQTVVSTRIKQGSATLNGVFSPAIVVVASLNGSIDAGVQASLSVTAGIIKQLDSVLTVNTTLDTSGGYLLETNSNLVVSTNLTANPISYVRATRRNVIIDDYGYDSFFDSTIKKFGDSSYRISEPTAGADAGVVVFDGSNFKNVGSGFTWTSSDGIAWSKATNNLTGNAFDNIYYINARYFLRRYNALTSAYQTYTSTNATTWSNPSNITYTYIGTTWYRLQHSIGTTWSLARSFDFSNWTVVTNTTGVTNSFNSVGASGNNDAAFAIDASNNIVIHQYNSITNWSTTATITGENVQDFQYLNNEWMLQTRSGKIYTSTDLTSWTLRRTFTNIGDISYINGFYYYLGNSLLYKGSTIEALTLSTDRHFNYFQNFNDVTPVIGNAIVYGNGKYIATSPRGGILYSSDGINWEIDRDTDTRRTFLNNTLELNDLDSNLNLTDWNSIDFWYYPNGSQVYMLSYDNSDSTRTPLLISSNTSVLDDIIISTAEVTVSSQLFETQNAWNHVRVVKSGSNISAYSNGTRVINNTNLTIPLSTKGFKIGGFITGSETLNIDEFLVTRDVLNNPNDTSITVPTAPWLATENTLSLLHFDNSFEDDVTAVRDGNASLSSTVTITAALGGTFDATANLTTTATLNADVDKIFDAGASIAATATASATANNILDATSNLNAAFAQTASALRIRSGASNISSAFTQTAAANIRAGAVFSDTAMFELSATTIRIKQLDATLNAFVTTLIAVAKVGDFFVDADLQATLVASAQRTAAAGSTHSAVVDLTATAIKIHPGVAALDSSAALSADADLLAGGIAELATTAALTATAICIKSLAAQLDSAFSLTATGVTFLGTTTFNAVVETDLTAVATRIKQLASTLAVVATQAVEGTKLVEAAATLNGVFSPSIQAVASLNGSIDLTVTADLSTDVQRSRGVVADFNSAFTATATGLTFLGTTTFSGAAEFAVDCDAVVIRSAISNLNTSVDLAVSATTAISAQATLNGVFSPSIQAVASRAGDIDLFAVANASATPVKTVSVACTAPATATLAVSAGVISRTSVALAASAQLTATGGGLSNGVALLSAAFSVAAEGREIFTDRYVYTIPREQRTFTVNRETRSHTVHKETRIYILGEL